MNSLRFDRLAGPVLALSALAVACTGLTRLPLSGAEIAFARTAQHLLRHADSGLAALHAGVPFPLGLWASIAVARLMGADHVGTLAARLPEMIAGVVFAWVVFAIGRRQRNTTAGLVAGLIALTSPPFVLAVHDARPAMLYGLCAVLMLAAWQGGVAARTASRRWGWALLFWATFVLAALAGGPRLGALALVAGLVHALPAGLDGKRPWRWLWPLAGLLFLLLAAVAVGELMSGDAGAARWPLVWMADWAAPGWQYVPPGTARDLLLVWCAWLVAAIPAAIAAWRNRGGLAGLCLLWLGFGAALIGQNPAAAGLYVPALMAPLSLLLAFGVERLVASTAAVARFGYMLLAILLGLGSLGVMAACLATTREVSVTRVACTAVAVLLVSLALWRLARVRADDGARRGATIVLLAIALVLALVQAMLAPALWNAQRYRDHDLALELRAYPQRSIAAYAPLDPGVFDYYLDRSVRRLHDGRALCAWAQAHAAGRGLVLFRPREANAVLDDVGGLALLLQSPGTPTSSVIVAEVRPDRAPTCVRQAAP